MILLGGVKSRSSRQELVWYLAATISLILPAGDDKFY